jgi:hypothetical protein
MKSENANQKAPRLSVIPVSLMFSPERRLRRRAPAGETGHIRNDALIPVMLTTNRAHSEHCHRRPGLTFEARRL